VQTFLPNKDFRTSFAQLDYRRLGKQRVEAEQLIRAINGEYTRGWVNHPCTRMWREHVECLQYYRDLCILEWVNRGYKNTMPFTRKDWLKLKFEFPNSKKPEWLGKNRLHSSHRAALLHKDVDFYSQFGWKEAPKLEYYWPR